MTEQEWREKFGMVLTRLITDRGCTRREFSDELGISEKTLDHYIHGRRTPSATSLLNLAKFIDCPLEKLMDFGEKVRR